MTNGNEPITPCMLQKVGDDENAFRAKKDKGDDPLWSFPVMGLTKREYFAAMAMQGLLANSEWMKTKDKEKYLMSDSVRSEISVKAANSLIKALNK